MKYIVSFSLTFAITFIVSVIVTYLYSLFVHGHAMVNWETAVDLAIILGILLPFVEHRGKKNKV